MTDKQKFIELFKDIKWPLEPGFLEDSDLMIQAKDNQLHIGFDDNGKFVSFYTPYKYCTFSKVSYRYNIA